MLMIVWIVGVFGLSTAVAMACTSGGQVDQGDPTADPADIVTSGLAEPSSRQLEMIADGDVTFEEYDEAYFAYYDCVLDSGIRVREEPRLDVHGLRYEASFRMGSSDEEFDENTAKHNICLERHLLSVLYVWSRENRPSEALLQEATAAVVSCLANEDIEMPSHLSVDDFGILLEAASSGEVALLPPSLSLDDIEALLSVASDAFLAFISCRTEVGQQYPVGW